MKKVLLSLFAVGILFVSAQAYAFVEVEPLVFKSWAVEDSSIIAGSYAGENYGYREWLIVKDSTSNSPARSLLKFDLDAIVAGLGGLDIVAVSLHLYEYSRSPSSANDGINLFGVTSTWGEGTITWTTQPTYEGINVTSRPFNTDDTTPGWRSWQGSAFDDLAKAWVSGGKNNYGLMLENDLDGTYNEMNVTFRSSEYLTESSLRPYLKITATPEPFSAVLFGIGSCLLGAAAIKRKKII